MHIGEGEYESGARLLQQSCDVLENDSPESLAERVTAIEHIILPQAIQIIADKITSNK